MVLTGEPGSSKVSVAMPSASSYAYGFHGLQIRFDDGGDAHAAAHAQRGQAVAQLAAMQLVDQRVQDHRAGGAQRVAHGDGAAVDVDLVVRHAHVLHERIGTAAKASLISNRSIWSMVMPALASALRAAGIGPVSMMVGSAPDEGGRDDARARLEAVGLAGLLAADQHRGGAVDDARGVAGVMHMVDALDLRIAAACATVVEAHRAHLVEGRLAATRGPPWWCAA